MNILINPGSKISGGTFVQAKKNAQKWLKKVHEHFPEVQMIIVKKPTDGRWNFIFRHPKTKKEILLEMHGLTDAEEKKYHGFHEFIGMAVRLLSRVRKIG